jgi:hypothetical protein
MTQKKLVNMQPNAVHIIECALGTAHIDLSRVTKRSDRWCVPVIPADFDRWEQEMGALIAAAHRANPNVNLELDHENKTVWVRGARTVRSDRGHAVAAAGRFMVEVSKRFQTTVGSKARATRQQLYFAGQQGPRVWDREAWLESRREAMYGEATG